MSCAFLICLFIRQPLLFILIIKVFFNPAISRGNHCSCSSKPRHGKGRERNNSPAYFPSGFSGTSFCWSSSTKGVGPIFNGICGNLCRLFSGLVVAKCSLDSSNSIPPFLPYVSKRRNNPPYDFRCSRGGFCWRLGTSILLFLIKVKLLSVFISRINIC